jgi:16S rRNA (guanine(1405)-N(7))-methyltransferase
MEGKELIAKIKASKKYKDISEEAIKTKVEEYLAKNKNPDEKIALKDIKTSLHRAHGSFRLHNKKLDELLSKKDFIKILDVHRSTRERLLDYEKIYEKIFKITGKPKAILDLGCGLNPCSIPLMKLDSILEYYAYDINKSEIEFLNNFFRIFNINGVAQTLDLTNIENVKKLPEADLCLMWKLVDVLEKDGHKYSEEIIKILSKKCRFIAVSFATQTISGKKMMFAERGWIERMLQRIGMKFEKIIFDSEIFYVIGKIV